MQRPAVADPPENAKRSRVKLFAFGVLGLLVAVGAAILVDGLLGGEARVSSGFFVAAAALTPVIGLGLLAQLVAALAGRTRRLLHELSRFSEEMEAEPPKLSDESQRERRATWEGVRAFRQVLAPFVAGLALQLVATEAAAIYCLAAGVDERVVALAIGLEIFVLFNYLLFFSPLLARLTESETPPPVA